ncbi:MAG: hypothetical protein ACN2B6_11940 [Rickettsiales bacterium]
MKAAKILRIGVTALFLVTISGCSNKEIVYRTEQVCNNPDLLNLPEIENPSFEGETNLDLLLYSVDISERLQQCLDDREKVRLWLIQQQQTH